MASGLHEKVFAGRGIVMQKIWGAKMNWTHGVFLIGFLGFFFAVHPLIIKKKIKYYFFWILIFPLAVTLTIYWSPSLLNDYGEYRDWAYIFIAPWLISGYTGALIGALLVSRFWKNIRKP